MSQWAEPRSTLGRGDGLSLHGRGFLWRSHRALVASRPTCTAVWRVRPTRIKHVLLWAVGLSLHMGERWHARRMLWRQVSRFVARLGRPWQRF